MKYADFTYYRDEYCGSLIPEEQFGYYSARASEYIDQQTFDRLSPGVPEELTGKVSSCCCEVAENLYRFDSAYSNSSNGGAGNDIASETNGQYSVTYRSTAEKVSDANAILNGMGVGLFDLIRSIINKHLGNTGLLFRGVD